MILKAIAAFSGVTSCFSDAKGGLYEKVGSKEGNLSKKSEKSHTPKVSDIYILHLHYLYLQVCFCTSLPFTVFTSSVQGWEHLWALKQELEQVCLWKASPKPVRHHYMPCYPGSQHGCWVALWCHMARTHVQTRHALSLTETASI